MIRPAHRIQQLSAHLVNQIAAGEVIERPASVVKELLENSLDAGAKNIVVELEEGGKRSIRITDDGGGIAPADLPLAVASHATSKLRCEEDLHRVTTLGFRGEALASIASVAELELVSRPADHEVGECIVAQDGTAAEGAPVMIPPGTRITVQNLFYNVPARKRFLKSDRGELARIHTAVKHIALARPDVGFTLVNGGRSVFRCPADQEPRQRVAEVLGEEHAGRLLELPEQPRLRGWVGRPDFSKRNSQGIYTFLNGRFVRDATVLHGIREGYRGFQIPGQYPVAVLFLELDPEDVDVNVHPAKLEVRFRDSSDVHRLVHRAIRDVLEQTGSVPSLLAGRGAAPPLPSSVPPRLTADDVIADTPIPVLPGLVREGPLREGAQREGTLREAPFPGAPSREPAAGGDGGSADAAAAAGPQQADAFGPAPMRVFQLRDSYLMIEEADGLTVIDQHALHEKILYEEILEARERGDLRQPLLVPETVELTPEEWQLFIDHQQDLADLGLEAEEFGDGVVALRALPAGFERGGAPLLRLALDRLRESKGSKDAVDLRDRLVATMACKRAVKAGQRLGPAQQLDLVQGRARAFQPQNCPHGRPSELFISWEELDRRFDRK